MRSLVLTALLCASGPALADQITGSQFQTGYWAGAAYTDNKTGDFLYCDVSVSYTNGEVLWLGLYNNDVLAVLMTHPEVRYEVGATFDAWLMLETGMPIRQVAEAWDTEYAGMSLAGIDQSIQFLTAGQWLRLLGIGIDGAYDVTGIGDALAMARTCHAKYSGSNPFAVIGQPAEQPPAPEPLPEPDPVATPVADPVAAAEPEPAAPALGTPPPMPKVPDLRPKTGGGLGTRPGGALGTPAPKPQP